MLYHFPLISSKIIPFDFITYNKKIHKPLNNQSFLFIILNPNEISITFMIKNTLKSNKIN